MKYRRLQLLVTVLITIQSLALLGSSQAKAQTTEVIAIEDITATANCSITWKIFRDNQWNDLKASRTDPCPPATVFQSFRTTEAEAIAAGLTYVVLTGDPVTDDAAVTVVQVAQLNADSWEMVEEDIQQCRTNSYTKTLEYGTGAYNSRGKDKTLLPPSQWTMQ